MQSLIYVGFPHYYNGLDRPLDKANDFYPIFARS